jgi:hypothetical protein
MGDIINIDKAFDEMSEKEQDEFFDALDKMTEEEQLKVMVNMLKKVPFDGSDDLQGIISGLIRCFQTILKELKIDKVTEFNFVESDYPRLVKINGKEYDLDGAFDKDEEAGAALYEIDALIGDLVCDFGMKCEQVLKLIEKEIKK